MMVTPDRVSVWYLRPFDSNSMTWAWPRPIHNSARAQAQTSRFMRQFYDTGDARSRLFTHARTTQAANRKRWDPAEPPWIGGAGLSQPQCCVLESGHRPVAGARHTAPGREPG